MRIGEIMSANVLFYNPLKEEDLIRYCVSTNLSCLPDFEGKFFYFLNAGRFEKRIIEESYKVYPSIYIFERKLLEKFLNEFGLLFVFEENRLVGIIHYSDYNKVEVYTYLYKKIAEVERILRKLLVLSGLKNDDMIEFFKTKGVKNDEYRKAYEEWSDELNKEKLKNVGQFELFNLSQIIALANKELKIGIKEDLNLFRNWIMHSRRIEDFRSFEKFFNYATYLEMEYKKLSNLLILSESGVINRIH